MKLQRLIAILTTLLQKDRINATALASMFEVSVRTIYRDIETLELAGIPIVTYPGVNGGIAIMEQYKIDKKLFTNQDISTLLTSLYSVSGSIPNGTLNQTLEKIKSLIPNEYGKSIELTSKQLYIDMAPWSNNPQVTLVLKQVQKALSENKVIGFSYTRLHGETTPRTVEPHQLILKESNWYLRAFCFQRNDFRIFKLRRIKDIAIRPQTFEPRDFDTHMTDFKDWKNDKLTIVELIIHASLREKALDHCREEYLEDLGDGRIYIKMPFVESEIGYDFLLSLSYKCQVIAPIHIRDEIIHRIDLMQMVYKPL